MFSAWLIAAAGGEAAKLRIVESVKVCIFKIMQSVKVCTEMQKAADLADISVIFFLVGVDF